MFRNNRFVGTSRRGDRRRGSFLQTIWQRSLHWLGLSIALVVMLASCQTLTQAQQQQQPMVSPGPTQMMQGELSASPAELPPLPYPYDALEPYIDAETMELHHDRHHASYVNNLNEALEDYPDRQNRTVEDLLLNLESLPDNLQTPVRNNGGGHVNHTMFWQIMSPDGGGEPTGAIADAINQAFGNFRQFQEEFESAGTDQFGSGWAWLVVNEAGNLEIMSTPNQDSPLMEGYYPVLGNDVWEHAYYLTYRNRRAEYLSQWWNVVNWEEVNRRFEQATAQSADQQ